MRMVKRHIVLWWYFCFSIMPSFADSLFLYFNCIAFIIASGTTLDLKVVLPFVQFNPEITSIEFDVEVTLLGVTVA